MVFSSVTFLLFFLPAALVLYYALPGIAYKNCVLFFASLLFYAWGEPKFLFLMLASVVFNYNMGLFLGGGAERRKRVLVFAVLVNLGALFVFKYMGFSCKIVNVFLRSLHLHPLSALKLIMPIGISFYTFQSISYLVDVYRNPSLVQKDFLHLGLYITFFPQLIAGPIVRYHDINTQISARTVTVAQFARGLERFIVGLSKKVLLANAFAQVCDPIYGTDVLSYGTYAAWIAAFAYALQIYYDFSGYSAMAIGLAKLFGFELLENFNYPYAATSITDFWRRWHISLTNFFRDYVYIPLGGNRRGAARTSLNRFIVFFTTGLWHGGHFVLWGLSHGGLMTAERLLGGRTVRGEKKRGIVAAVFGRIYTLLFVMLLWVLFRNGTKETVKLLLKMFGVNYTRFTDDFIPVLPNPFLLVNISTKFYILAAIGVLLAFPWWRKIPFLYTKRKGGAAVLCAAKYVALGCLFVLCYASLADSSYNPFIYFRF